MNYQNCVKFKCIFWKATLGCQTINTCTGMPLAQCKNLHYNYSKLDVMLLSVICVNDVCFSIFLLCIVLPCCPMQDHWQVQWTALCMLHGPCGLPGWLCSTPVQSVPCSYHWAVCTVRGGSVNVRGSLVSQWWLLKYSDSSLDPQKWLVSSLTESSWQDSLSPSPQGWCSWLCNRSYPFTII